MKIELIKRNNGNGDTWYHIEVDGNSKVATPDYDKAVDLYSNWGEPTTEILFSREFATVTETKTT